MPVLEMLTVLFSWVSEQNKARSVCRGGDALAGQIISKSCSFSPETELTPLILASKSD